MTELGSKGFHPFLGNVFGEVIVIFQCCYWLKTGDESIKSNG